jgi:hypothetical protein
MSNCAVFALKSKMSNKPDPANPAMALWLAIGDQWRRVADLGHSPQQ